MTGGWAATNTLREGIGAVEGDRDIGRELLRVQAAENALALVETALDAADSLFDGAVGYTVDNEDRITVLAARWAALAAALRAVREGK